MITKPKGLQLSFHRVEGQCCILCNWPALADLESECVRVDLAAFGRRAICFPCIDALVLAKESRRNARPVIVELDPELTAFLREREIAEKDEPE